MESITNILGLTINAIFTTSIFMSFLGQMFEKRCSNRIIYAVTFISWILVSVLIGTAGIPLLNTTVFTLQLFITCFLLYERDFRKTALYNSLLLVMLVAADVGTMMVGALVLGKPTEMVISDDTYALFFVLLYTIIGYVIYKIYLAIVKKSNVSGLKFSEAGALVVVVIFEFYTIHALAISAGSQDDVIRISVAIIGFAIFNLFLAYTMRRIGELYQQSIQLEAMKKQNKIQLAYYTSLNEKYRQSRKIIHDMKKHVSALSALKETDSERAEKYSKQIQSEMDSLFCGFHCTNQLLSIVMSQKISEAESEEIKVHTNVEDIAFDFIADYDMIGIFANLWDNSIEACRKADSERFINITIKKVNGFAAISFENSFNGKYRIKDGKILSTKSDHEGLGMTIIETAVQKHGGIMVTDAENNVFRTEITIPIPQQK